MRRPSAADRAQSSRAGHPPGVGQGALQALGGPGVADHVDGRAAGHRGQPVGQPVPARRPAQALPGADDGGRLGLHLGLVAAPPPRPRSGSPAVSSAPGLEHHARAARPRAPGGTVRADPAGRRRRRSVRAR